MPPSPLCPSLTLEYEELLKKKKEFEELFLVLTQATNDKEKEELLSQALSLKAELTEKKNTLEGKLFVSLQEAEAILGRENVLSAQDIETTYGFRPKLPHIPFKREELTFWKGMNEKYKEKIHFRLLYDVEETNEGEPLTIETIAKRAGDNTFTEPDGSLSYRLYNDQFDDKGTMKKNVWFKKEEMIVFALPSGEWKIVSDEILPNSIEKNYIKQTDFLINFWRTEVFPALSKEEREAYETLFTQWEKEKPKLEADALASHPLSQIIRESIASILSRIVMIHKSRNKKILTNTYAWSNTPSSLGHLAYAGFFGSGGALVNGLSPDAGWADDGVLFSRSVILKRGKMKR